MEDRAEEKHISESIDGIKQFRFPLDTSRTSLGVLRGSPPGEGFFVFHTGLKSMYSKHNHSTE